MENQEVVVMKKKCSAGKVIAIILVLAAICVIAAKLYKKYFAKKDEELLDECEECDCDALEGECDACVEEDAAVEVPAEAVIANAAEME